MAAPPPACATLFASA